MPAKKRIRQHFYTATPLPRGRRSVDVEFDGYLYANGVHKTGLSASDLPHYFAEFDAYGTHCYLSAKDVRQLAYRANYLTHHLHKDDLLYVAFGDTLSLNPDGGILPVSGHDHLLYGSALVKYLRAVAEFGSLDLAAIMQEVERKEAWFRMLERGEAESSPHESKIVFSEVKN